MTLCQFLKTKFNMSLIDQMRNESAPQSVCSYSSFLFDTDLLLLPKRVFKFSARRRRFAITWTLSVCHLKWNENDELEAFSRLETNIEQWETSSNKSQKYFVGRKSTSFTFVKSVQTHFLTNWSILLIGHICKTKNVMKFCAQLCKNEKRKTRCLTNCMRSKIRLWVPSKQLFDCLYKVKNKTLGFIKATE